MNRKKRKKIQIIAAAAVTAAAVTVLVLALAGVFSKKPPAPSPTAAPTPVSTPSPVPTKEAVSTPSPTPAETSSPTPTPVYVPTEYGRNLYEVSLTLFPNDRIPHGEGQMRLNFVNTGSDVLYEVKLRLHPNDKSPGCMYVNEASAQGAPAFFTVEGSILTVALAREISPGESAEVFIDFIINFPELDGSFGKNETGLMLGNTLPIACVYENGAWRTDPYHSEGDPYYSQISDYKVAVTFPSTHELAHTGSLMEQEKEGVWNKCYIVAEKVREFAIALVEDAHVSEAYAKEGGVTVRCLGTSWASAKFGAETAAQAVDFFSEKIGLLPCRDLYVVPFSASGGMEYPGLIMINEDAFRSSNRATGTSVIAHEVAHQWFYSVAGSDQINSPWLDESLVEFLGMTFAAQTLSEKDVSKLNADRSATLEGYDRTIPIDAPIYSFDERNYYRVIYAAGYELFDELYDTVGESAFFAALQNYYNEASFTFGTKEMLISAFEAAAEAELLSWFDSRLAAPVQ